MSSSQKLLLKREAEFCYLSSSSRSDPGFSGGLEFLQQPLLCLSLLSPVLEAHQRMSFFMRNFSPTTWQGKKDSWLLSEQMLINSRNSSSIHVILLSFFDTDYLFSWLGHPLKALKRASSVCKSMFSFSDKMFYFRSMFNFTDQMKYVFLQKHSTCYM